MVPGSTLTTLPSVIIAASVGMARRMVWCRAEICLNQNRGVQRNGKRGAVQQFPLNSFLFHYDLPLSVIQVVLPFDRGKVECDDLL